MYGLPTRFGRRASLIACIILLSSCSTLDKVSGPEQSPAIPEFSSSGASGSDSTENQQGEDQDDQGSTQIPSLRGLDGSALIGVPLPPGIMSGLLSCPVQPEWSSEARARTTRGRLIR